LPRDDAAFHRHETFATANLRGGPGRPLGSYEAAIHIAGASRATAKGVTLRSHSIAREDIMPIGNFSAGGFLGAALMLMSGGASAFDDSNYPDLKGQWNRQETPGIAPSFDPTKRPGLAQKAPLTPEYQKVLEASLADQAAGGGGFAPDYLCISSGMPMRMTAYTPLEFIVTADTTHIAGPDGYMHRRIYTDGRDWPADVEPSRIGYSIGRWIDEDADGKFDTLLVETRYFRGQRAFDQTGIPLHEDNQTVVMERIYLDKTNRNILHDEMTVIDHALTRPWTVMKSYVREPSTRPVWIAWDCAEGNPHVRIGPEDYMVGGDGLLMPAKKGQQPPDLKYFEMRK
jgi:hypothetical protein